MALFGLRFCWQMLFQIHSGGCRGDTRTLSRRPVDRSSDEGQTNDDRPEYRQKNVGNRIRYCDTKDRRLTFLDFAGARHGGVNGHGAGQTTPRESFVHSPDEVTGSMGLRNPI